MKKIVFLFIILSAKIFAQTTYRINLQVASFSCGCSSFGGDSFYIYDSSNNVITPTNSDFTNYPSVSFETNVKPTKIINVGGCEPTGDEWCYPFPFTLTSTVIFGAGSCSYSTSTDGDKWGLKANLQEMNINNTGCVTNGISCSGSIERWEVKKAGSNTYQAIPNSNVNTLNLTYSQVYSDNSGISKTTYFRAKFTGTEVYTYHPFVFIPCPPNLLSTSEPNITACNYSNGDVTFTFSRPIEDNEKFIFSCNIPNTDLFFSANSNDAEKVEKISATVFKWKNLPAGTYDFRYQTQFGDGQPSEFVNAPPFTIKAQEKLFFTTTIIQPACNSDKGKVQISATGGTPPYFYYIDDETIEDKHPFTSPYILPNELSEGNHKVTVIDSEKCIEKSQ